MYVLFPLFALMFPLCVNRDGLLFELENGKPKLILLNHGETSQLYDLLLSWEISHNYFLFL